MYQDSGGSNALRGFVYQFLHTLLGVIEAEANVRVRWEGQSGRSDQTQELLFRIEAYEDFETRQPGQHRLFQLKDRETFGPAEFAKSVLSPFMREFTELRRANPEFVLYTSADLGGGFYEPFRQLCGKLAECRENMTLPTEQGAEVDALLPDFRISTRRAQIWSAERAGEPNARELRANNVSESLDQMLECAFVRQAGIQTVRDLLDFLSRVTVDDGHGCDELYVRVRSELEKCLPISTVSSRLNEAIALLMQRAAQPSSGWTPAHQLLQDLRLPPPISWGSVAQECGPYLERRLATGQPTHLADRDRQRARAFFGLFLKQDEPPSKQERRRLFVLAFSGWQGSDDALVHVLAREAARYAPTVLVNASASDDDIVSELLTMADWEEPHPGEWPLQTLLPRLSASHDRLPDRPSLVLMLKSFSGSDPDLRQVDRLVGLLRRTGGLLLVAGHEASFRMVPPHVADEWRTSLWRPGSNFPALIDRQRELASCVLTPVELNDEQSLDASAGPHDRALPTAEWHIAGHCKLTHDATQDALDHLVVLACSPDHTTGRIPIERVEAVPCWEPHSTRRDRLPQAAVDAGVLRCRGQVLELGDGEAAAELVAKRVAKMPVEERVRFSQRLAQSADPHEAIVNGFARWFARFAPTAPDTSELVKLCRPWAEGPILPWTPCFFEAVGGPALEPMARIVEQAAETVPPGLSEERDLSQRVRHVFKLMRATGDPQLGTWAREWAQGAGHWLRREILSFFVDVGDDRALVDLLDELRRASRSAVAADMADMETKLALPIAKKGVEAVPRILERLDPSKPDCVPLLVALGEIGSPTANSRLEKLAEDFDTASPVGLHARKALTLCESELTGRLARETLASADPEAVELGFWMVIHGRCRELHNEVVDAAERLAAERNLEGTRFLEASTVCRESATTASWDQLSYACRTVLARDHTIWLYRPMIRCGLPDACALLLHLIVRLWQEHGKAVSGIMYALGALAEGAVSEVQVRSIESFASDSERVAALSEVLRMTATEDGFGWSLQVAARLGLPSFAEMCASCLDTRAACWQAVELGKMVPVQAAIEKLSELAAQENGNPAFAIKCAEALAAQPYPGAFDKLVSVLRCWDELPVTLADAFACSVYVGKRMAECRTWLSDASEAKCLRQASSIAVGLALKQGPIGANCEQLVEALSVALGEGGDIGHAAAAGCQIAAHAGLLDPLQDVVMQGEEPAFEALQAIAAIQTPEALQFLYHTWEERDLYFMEGMPTTALAQALRGTFQRPEQRDGNEWVKATGWLQEAYGQFISLRGTRTETSPDGRSVYKHVSTDMAIAHALLALALEWGADSFIRQIEEGVWTDAATWLSSPAVHLQWQVLARHRPKRFIEAAKQYAARPVSDSSKPHFVRALLSVTDPSFETDVVELVLATAAGAKTQARRRVALELAQAHSRWLDDLAPNEDYAPLLRDVAAFAEEEVAQSIIDRLTSAPTRSIRRYGYEVQALRADRQRALATWERFGAETDPHRRLWWMTTVATLADESLLPQLMLDASDTLDLQKKHCLSALRKEATRRLEKESRDEDRHRSSGSRPWVW